MSSAAARAIARPRPQPELTIAGRIADLIEFLEDGVEFGRRHADAGVSNLDREPGATTAAAHQDLAGLRVADGVRDQILDDALEQAAVAADHGGCRHDAQSEALRRGQALELPRDRGQQLMKRQFDQVRSDGAALQLVKIEQRVERVAHRVDRVAELLDRPQRLRIGCLTGQDRALQIQRLQGLAQIMARRSEKARLGGVRPLGALLGFPKLVLGLLPGRHVAIGLQHQRRLSPGSAQEFLPALDDHAAPIAGRVDELTHPSAIAIEQIVQRQIRHDRHGGEQIVAAAADRLRRRIAVQALRASVPIDDRSVQLPYQDGLEGKLEQLGLLLEGQATLGAGTVMAVELGTGESTRHPGEPSARHCNAPILPRAGPRADQHGT